MLASRLLTGAALTLAPSLALAQGAVPTARLPPGSTGSADGLTVGGTAIPAILGSKAPLASPTFSGTVTAPAFSGDASAMVATPSPAASAGSLSRLLAPSYGLGLSTYYMPPPSGSAATDAANFAAAQATGARTIALQTGGYLVPAAGWSALRSGQCLIGQGADLTTITATAQTGVLGMLNAVNVTNVCLTGLTLDYAGKSAPSATGGILVLHNAKGVRLTDVNVVGWPIMGISANGGSDFSYRRGVMKRAATPYDTSGAAMPLGRQTQCILVSSSFAIATRYLYEDVSCDGAGFDTWGSGFKYVRTSVTGWSFGGAYTVEQYDGSDDHVFLNVSATGGRTRSAAGTKPSGDSVAAGFDDNDTSMLCVESWASRTVVDGLICDDAGGDGIGLGGPNSRIVNSRLSRIGMQVPSDGIKTRVGSGGVTGKYTATGSLIANNTVVNSNGSGDGSNLLYPYDRESADPSIVVTIGGNDFGNTASTKKGLGEVWASPGMLVRAVTSNGYTHPYGSRQAPAGGFIAGVNRAKDVAVGATFRAANGAGLPAGLRLSAEVTADSNVIFRTEDISGGNSDIAVPAGTYSARLITIN